MTIEHTDPASLGVGEVSILHVSSGEVRDRVDRLTWLDELMTVTYLFPWEVTAVIGNAPWIREDATSRQQHRNMEGARVLEIDWRYCVLTNIQILEPNA